MQRIKIRTKEDKTLEKDLENAFVQYHINQQLLYNL